MVRYTLELESELHAILKELAASEGTTKADILRRAVATYAFLHKQTTPRQGQDGAGQLKVSLTDWQDRVVTEVLLP